MPLLWGERLTRRELLGRVGRVEQAGGLRRLEFTEGPEAGSGLIEFDTGLLSLELLPSRGLDLGAARYQGRPLAYLSPAGFPHPAFAEREGEGFVRTFGGGLMVTGGLENVGSPNVDEGVTHGLHGRASTTPASMVGAWGEWVGDEYLMTVRGVTREASLYGSKLERTRTVSARLGESSLSLVDVVENAGPQPAAALVLYHFNLGWPLLSPGARVEAPSEGVEVIEGSADGWAAVPPPAGGARSTVLEHRMTPGPDGWVRVRLRSGGLTLEIAYDASTLPVFTQWGMYGLSDYALGLEPGNVGVRGRAAERAAGRLPVLEPGERRTFRLEVSVSETA